MRIVVIDFECTCWRDKLFKRTDMEIIEIGAILYNIQESKKELVYRSLVKPKLFPHLSDFCIELTKIKQEDIDRAHSFPYVLDELLSGISKKCSPSEVIMSSYGEFDKKQLIQDCNLWNLPYPFVPDRLLNIKEYAKVKLGKRMGLSNALIKAEMEFAGIQHQALDDANNALRLLRKFIEEDTIGDIKFDY